jgi:hypothetical protein
MVMMTRDSRAELQGPESDTAVRERYAKYGFKTLKDTLLQQDWRFSLLVPQPPMTPGVEGRDTAIYKLETVKRRRETRRCAERNPAAQADFEVAYRPSFRRELRAQLPV